MDEIEFFNEKDFEYFRKSVGKKKDMQSPEDQEIYNYLRDVTYKKIQYWADKCQQKIFPDRKLSLIKRPTNEWNFFKSHLWAAIYPNNDSNLPFTVAIITDKTRESGYFEVRLGTEHWDDSTQQKVYDDYLGAYESSPLVNTYNLEETLQLDWGKLIENTILDIKALEYHYNKLFSIMGFDKSNDKLIKGKEMIKYYLMGTNWDGEEQIDRFLENGIWQSGYADDEKVKELVNSINIQDRIALKSSFATKGGKSVLRVKAFGTVISNVNNGIELKVKWDNPIEYFDLENYGYYRKTVEVVKEEDINVIFKSTFIQTINSNKDISKQPLNRILYGPPGTGKTYNAITHALSIIENIEIEVLENQKREELKKRFDKLLIEDLNESSGNIAFCTFHQSMSYEDFVEGIKPTEPNGEKSLEYDIEDGIFKAICDKANYSVSVNFDEAYSKLLEDLEDNKLILMETPRGKKFGVKVNRNYNLNLLTGENFNEGTGIVKKNHILDLFKGPRQGYRNGIINYLKEKYNYKEDVIQTDTKPFVLIIDEINRGNVSQIFGELITLIEKDKRAGALESLSVTLPYSKKSFSVPSNLYIIGTMNTADRSVEALDTALRRRFDFIEMSPKPEKLDDVPDIEGINLHKLLEVINGRIELLLDKDHLIGHSYFLHLKDISDLKNAFQNKIIPLLQEYFYGDYGKIGLVLGDGFCEELNELGKAKFSKFKYDDASELRDRKIYRLKNISSMKPPEFTKAVIEII